MADNFKIYVHRNSENLHLKLAGDLDGHSVRQLIAALQKNAYRADKIFIHTLGLQHIDPLGRDLFQDTIGQMNPGMPQILLTGTHASQLAPPDHEGVRVVPA